MSQSFQVLNNSRALPVIEPSGIFFYDFLFIDRPDGIALQYQRIFFLLEKKSVFFSTEDNLGKVNDASTNIYYRFLFLKF